MTDSTSPLFDLTTLASSDFFAIDGRRCPLLNVDALGLRARAAFVARSERIAALEVSAKAGTATDADEDEYESLMREFVHEILPTAPAEVLAALPIGKLVALGSAFFVWLQRESPLPAALSRIMTTAKPSPASPVSMVPGNGSSKRRRAS